MIKATGIVLLTGLLLAGCASRDDKTVRVEGGLVGMADLSPSVSGSAPPLKAFASLPEVEEVTLSPSGKYLAFLKNIDGETALVTLPVEGGKAQVVITSNNEKFRMAHYYWVGDERLLISVRFPEKRYGVDTVEGRLIAINRDGSNLQGELFQRRPYGFDGGARNANPQFQDQIVGFFANDSKHVLVSLGLDDPIHPAVYSVDVESGSRQKVQNNWAGITRWMADENGNIRIGVAELDSPPRVLVKPRMADDWITPKAFEIWTRVGKVINPLGFDAQSDNLYFAADYQGKLGIYRLNIAETNANPALLKYDPKYDIGGKLIYSANPGRAIGAYYAADELKAVYWDKAGDLLQRRLNKVLPGKSNFIVSSSQDGNLDIVWSSSPTQPPQYFLLNQKANQISLLSETYPKLKPASLSETRSIHFKARDGLQLTGYLTLPKSDTGKPLPVIILPHGGPYARDVNSFDYWTQFFASRGWGVLKINYRGSAGMGEAFENAGFQRWGLEMQDDISDGANWLRQEGIAKPDRICIVGGSYGGYAALMGLAKTPGLYRCGISFAGVADLLDLVSHLGSYAINKSEIDQKLGGWWSDHARLKATSPINLAGSIKSPLLIAHGVMDRSVPVQQSRDMVSALKDAGVGGYRYVEMPLADHHLSRQEDRVLIFEEMERFLTHFLNE